MSSSIYFWNFGDKKTAFDCDKDGNELPCDIAGVLTPPETPNGKFFLL